MKQSPSRCAETAVAPVPRPRSGRPPIPRMRERILLSATELFGEKEFHRVRTDDIAARAGVGKGSVYRQFGSKEELYAIVVIDGFARLQTEMRAALADVNSLSERIKAVVTRTLCYFWKRRQFFALLNDPGALPRRQARRYLARRRGHTRLISELLAEGVAAGAIRSDLDLSLAAESLMGMIRGVNRHRDESVSLGDAVATVVSIFVAGCTRCESKHLASDARSGLAPLGAQTERRSTAHARAKRVAIAHAPSETAGGR